MSQDPLADVPMTKASGGARRTLGRYPTYEEAQAVVDRLSDGGFPVEGIAIVGGDLRMVEAVTGRLTTGRAALAGAASGAWFGLFIGVLVGLFTFDPSWLGLVLGGIVIGALWGAAFGFVGHAATGGRRDFSSLRTLAAGWYEITVEDENEAQARQLLAGTT